MLFQNCASESTRLSQIKSTVKKSNKNPLIYRKSTGESEWNNVERVFFFISCLKNHLIRGGKFLEKALQQRTNTKTASANMNISSIKFIAVQRKLLAQAREGMALGKPNEITTAQCLHQFPSDDH